MRGALRTALSLGFATIAGCTFAGVGRYDVARCDAGGLPRSLAEDPCSALEAPGAPGDACEVYQCDAATGRCVRGPRDADRDGEPARACGGNDCDDLDGRRSSRRAEQCDGVDDDCNGLADDGQVVLRASGPGRPGAFADASLADTGGADVVTSAVVAEGGVACVLALDERGTSIDAPCTFLGKGEALVPTQPRARPIGGGGHGAVFVDVSKTCPSGRVAYRNTKGAGFENACGSGESLPTFQTYDPATAPGRDLAVAAWLRAPAAFRAAPVAACSAAAEVPLDVAWIEGAGAREPAPRVYTRRLGLTTSRATRPPSLVPRKDAVLLAAPAEGGAGVWLLRPPAADGSGTSIIPLVPPNGLPLLRGAVSVGAAVATIGGVDHLALVGEIGCPPRQRVVFTLLRLDDPGPVATVVSERELTDAEMGVATAPRVAWAPARSEWWTAWVESRAADDLGPERVPTARGVTADGKAATDLLRAEVGRAREIVVRSATSGPEVTFDVLSDVDLARATTLCR